MNETPTAFGSCNRIEGRLYAIKCPRDQPVAGGTYPGEKNRLRAHVESLLQGGPPACRIRAHPAVKSIACRRNAAQPFTGIPHRGEVGEFIKGLTLLTVGLIPAGPEGDREPHGASAPWLINGPKEPIGGNPGGPSP